MKRLDVRAALLQNLTLLETTLWGLTALAYLFYRPAFLVRIALYAASFFLLLLGVRRGSRAAEWALLGLCFLFGTVGVCLLARSCALISRMGWGRQAPLLLAGGCWLAQLLCGLLLLRRRHIGNFSNSGPVSSR